MLILKKQCITITIYKQKLSLFGRVTQDKQNKVWPTIKITNIYIRARLLDMKILNNSDWRPSGVFIFGF